MSPRKRKRACTHEGTDKITGTTFAYPPLAPTHQWPWMVCNICEACGTWLPLGPAPTTDTDRVELLAAELATHCTDDGPPPAFTAQRGGWYLHQTDDPHGALWNSGRYAGWLAREIVTHKESYDA